MIELYGFFKCINRILNIKVLSIVFLLIFGGNAAFAQQNSSTPFSDIHTEFCLVNSTNAPITVNDVWSINENEWTGPFLPIKLIAQTVMANSASCWPLVLVKKKSNKYQFNIEINTNLGRVSWQVKQNDAISEIHTKCATEINDTNYYLLQKAGDNNGFSTNVFIIEENEKVQDDYLSNWMKDIPNNYKLKDILLIGTHDAGVNIQDGVDCNVPSALAVAQAWSISTQLHHGVRYFDIRLTEGNREQHYPYHKTFSFGCSSKTSFEQTLTDIVDFIKTHSTETIFLKISHTYSSIDSVIKMLDAWTKPIKTTKYFYKANIDTYRWTDKTMAELRGKIVFLLDCEFADYLNPNNGYFSFATQIKNCDPDDQSKVIYDRYSNTKYFSEMQDDQLNKLNKFGHDSKTLFLLSWTLTGGHIIAHTPRPAAYLANLSKEKLGKTLPMPNIIYYDFEDPGINTIFLKNYSNQRGPYMTPFS